MGLYSDDEANSALNEQTRNAELELDSKRRKLLDERLTLEKGMGQLNYTPQLPGNLIGHVKKPEKSAFGYLKNRGSK